MKEDLKKLIDSLRSGKYMNAEHKIQALADALLQQRADSKLILSLLRAPQVSLRQAAIAGCRGRKEADLLGELEKLATDPDVRIRRGLAETVAELPENQFGQTIRTLARDEVAEVRAAAMRSSSEKPLFIDLQSDRLGNDNDASVRIAAAQALHAQKVATVMRNLFHAFLKDGNSGVKKVCAGLIEARLIQALAANEKFMPTDFSAIEEGYRVLKLLGANEFPNLSKWINSKRTTDISVEELEKYGTDLTAIAEKGKLPRAYCVDPIVQDAVKIICAEQPRSIVLLGEAGVGKSAIVNALVYELAKPDHGGWHVVRVSPTEFLVGTKYLGEWQTKLDNIITLVRHPRRVILYIPNLSELSAIGKHDKSDANVATALAPYIQDGSVIILGESTPQEYAQGLGSVPSLDRLFAKVPVEETDRKTTQQILQWVRDDGGVDVPDAILDELLDLGDQYLHHVRPPGNCVSLLREVLSSHVDSGQAISRRTILDTISKSTGIPVDFLDDSIPLDLDETRSFLQERVMGQPEAIDAVVDLITLIKAGLTDPLKPFGVFLFVGPTGVGKTELARAIAEFVFGNPDRLQRFDMSEFASYDSFERLIGAGRYKGVLTEAIRQKPFSVVLFDEIEKAHINVFDLCLQIFDAGRLTDGHGRTVDFRSSVLILTSNVGFAGPGPIVGFDKQSVAQAQIKGADRERTFRELSRVFRPEFLNRLDRIINFRPLALEVAEQIARREINAVLQRTGIARRHLAIDIDPSLISLLIREGYSPSFGARPLKRAVERMLLQPLARAIASGKISGKMTLRATATNSRVEIKSVSTPATISKQTDDADDDHEDILTLVSELAEELEELGQDIIPLADRKSELLLLTQDRDFYRDAERRTSAFAEIHKLDQFLSAHEGLKKVVSGIMDRLSNRNAKIDETVLRQRIDQITGELSHLRFVATSDDAADLSDAILCIRLVDRKGKPIHGVETLTNMYNSFAKRRRVTAEVLCDNESESVDCIFGQLTGLGSYALLKREVGLHQLTRTDARQNSKESKEKPTRDQELIRVDVYPMEAPPDKAFLAKLKMEVVPSKRKSTRFLAKPLFDISLFHDPSLRSFKGCLPGPREQAIATAQLLFYTISERDDLGGSKPDHEQIIRQYDLGVSARVRDARSGKSIARLDQVLNGNLDLLTAQKRHATPRV